MSASYQKQYIYFHFWTNCPEVKIKYGIDERVVKVFWLLFLRILRKYGRIGMDDLGKKLTEKDVTEALSQREELLACYRQRLAMLSKEYEDSSELIELLQMRSPTGDIGNRTGGLGQGLDDIYLLYERQKKKYQEEIYQNMLQIMESIDRVKHVYLYYLQLPPKEQVVLKAIYEEKKPYKEIVTEKMSEQTINRLRKKGIQEIIHRWEVDNPISPQM